MNTDRDYSLLSIEEQRLGKEVTTEEFNFIYRGYNMAQRWHLHNQEQLDNFNNYVNQQRLAGKPPTVEFVKNQRSIDQNSMIYGLYGQIAAQIESESVLDIRRHCKLHYGVGILKAADPEFSKFYDSCIKESMSYEDKLLLMTYMDITSRKEFTTAMCSEYIDTIIKEYSSQGYSLMHPGENYE